MSQKIVLSETSPPPLADNDDKINGGSGSGSGNGNGNVPVSSKNKGGLSGVAKMLSKRVLQILSNLPLAIGEMFTIAALMALGIYAKVFFPPISVCLN